MVHREGEEKGRGREGRGGKGGDGEREVLCSMRGQV